MFGGYENVYRNEYVNLYSVIAQHFMTLCSLLLNCMLIYFIAKGSGKNIGHYRILVTCFAVNDLVYTIIHFLTYPIPETYNNTLIMGSHGHLTSQFFMCLYAANYGTSFPLLTAHFVYRALTLKWSQFAPNFHAFIALTIVMTIGIGGVWFFVAFFCFSADEESRMLTRPLLSGVEWSPVMHTNETAELYVMMGTYPTDGMRSAARWKFFAGAAIISSIMVAVYATILSCSYIIVTHVRTHAMSISSLRLQSQLFKCLVLQTLFPLLTAFFPSVFCIFAPIIGFTWPLISIVMPNFCVMHPIFDGAVVLFTVTEYRRSLTRFMLCSQPKTSSTTSLASASTTNTHTLSLKIP